MIMLANDIPAVLRFDPHTIYTFRRGPNAGRALKYVGPAERPFEDHVKVVTADGQPFAANFGRLLAHKLAVCKPEDLVAKV